MEYETLVGLSGDPVVEGGLGGPVVYSRTEQPVRALSGSARTQAQNHSPHSPHARMSRQSQDRETREQNLSSTIATRVCHDPENDHEAGIRVAFAPRHPQITHARATVLRVCTCAHAGRGWKRALCLVDLLDLFDSRAVQWRAFVFAGSRLRRRQADRMCVSTSGVRGRC